MNLPRIYFIAILLLAFSIGANSQEPQKAVLVDEFDGIHCDQYLGRVDNFFSELMSRPNNQGLAIISSKSRNPKGYLTWTTANIYLRQFDKRRIRIILSSGEAVQGVQFWRIPPGAKEPPYEDLPPPSFDMSRPFKFGAVDDNNVCSTFIPEAYAELIKGNLGSHGRIRVLGPDRPSRKSIADDYINELRKYGLSEKQIEVDYIHRPKRFLTEIEFWFIPAKKK